MKKICKDCKHRRWGIFEPVCKSPRNPMKTDLVSGKVSCEITFCSAQRQGPITNKGYCSGLGKWFEPKEIKNR